MLHEKKNSVGYLFNLFNAIMERQEGRIQLLESQEPMKVFCELSVLWQDVDFTTELLDIECDAGHSFINGPRKKIGERMFNIMMKNMVSETNQAIVEEKEELGLKRRPFGSQGSQVAITKLPVRTQ